VFVADQIKAYVDLLNRRQVRLYHACQFEDYCSYLDIGGIPSRKKMEESGKVFTAFATDLTDQERGVWDKVFVNLADFGDGFACGRQAIPNPYGPILLVISPDGLAQAQDVAICLRSAGANGYDREKEALKSLDPTFRTPKTAFRGFWDSNNQSVTGKADCPRSRVLNSASI